MLDGFREMHLDYYVLKQCQVLGVRANIDQLSALKELELFIWAMGLLNNRSIQVNFDLADLPQAWESHFAKIRLLQHTADEQRANELFREYVSLFGDNRLAAIQRKSDIEEALDQLTTKRRRAELGDTLFDRLAEGGCPTPAALGRDPEAGVAVRMAFTVRGVLERVLTFVGIRMKPRGDHLNEFYQTYSGAPDLLSKICDGLSADLWNQQVLPALEFRFALCNESSDYFDLECLKANAFASAHGLLVEMAAQNNLEEYLNAHPLTDPKALWEARMKILFPSLKLAQKGARIDWGKGGVTEEKLRVELARLNAILGEMGVIVRQGGEHLKEQLAIQRALTQQIVEGELYKKDPAYAAKVMADFEKYIQSPDSFLISVDINPLYSVAEILIAKIADEPPTYTVEFLYVDQAHREDYALGTLVQNIAESLVGHIPNARLVATVYSANENMPRHFRRGWVGTSMINDGKTIGLELYQGETSSSPPVLAQDHSHFVTLCGEHLAPKGDYLLVGVEPVSPSQNNLFPCVVQFGKTTAAEHFYRHGSL